jgi:hypothetical protein
LTGAGTLKTPSEGVGFDEGDGEYERMEARDFVLFSATIFLMLNQV